MGDWRSEDEPETLLKRELCLTQLTYYPDVNFVDEQAPAAVALKRARDEGWLRLQYTDTLALELSDAPAEKRQALLGLAADYAVTLGPVVRAFASRCQRRGV